MPEPERVPSTCGQCGDTDDHPKANIAKVTPDLELLGIVSKHHDCLSASEKKQLSESNPNTAKTIEACVSGKRGEKLRTYIQSIHKEEAK
jgi:hypothetical protein